MNAVTTNKKHIVLDDGFETIVNISEYGDMELLEDLVDLESDSPQVAATAMVSKPSSSKLKCSSSFIPTKNSG